MYLLEYAPADIREEQMKNPNLAYDDEKKKSRPHIVVMAGAVSTLNADPAITAVAPTAQVAVAGTPAAAGAPAPAAPAKPKKPKAANNDDPS